MGGSFPYSSQIVLGMSVERGDVDMEEGECYSVYDAGGWAEEDVGGKVEGEELLRDVWLQRIFF